MNTGKGAWSALSTSARAAASAWRDWITSLLSRAAARACASVHWAATAAGAVAAGAAGLSEARVWLQPGSAQASAQRRMQGCRMLMPRLSAQAPDRYLTNQPSPNPCESWSWKTMTCCAA